MSEAELDLSEVELREGLTACLAVPRWVEDVAARAPFASLAELLEVAYHAATPLTPDEVDQAMVDHPRIGEHATGEGKAQSFARAEQASSTATDADLTAALRAGNQAYEEKFDRVFLIRAAGRSRPEILAELRRRTALDLVTERALVGLELRDIALLRIPQLFAHLDHHSGFDESEAAQ